MISLAGRDTVVSSASATASFLLAITGPAWTGEADIDVLPFQGPRGTTISFTFAAIRDGHLDRAVKAAALHFPLPGTYNNQPLPPVHFPLISPFGIVRTAAFPRWFFPYSFWNGTRSIYSPFYRTQVFATPCFAYFHSPLPKLRSHHDLSTGTVAKVLPRIP